MTFLKFLHNETVARKHAQAVELFRDIQCGVVDAESFHGDGTAFATRLHDLWVTALLELNVLGKLKR